MPPASLAFTTPALRVRVDAPEPAATALATALRTFPGGGPTAPVDLHLVVEPTDAGWRATEADGTVHERPSLPRLTSTLVSRLNELHLDRDAARTHLHAAAVVAPSGAVVLAGHAGAGKSTLTAHLLGQGFGYLTDEAVGIDAEGGIHGYPKPLTLKYGSRRLTEGLREQLGLHRDPADGQRWEVPADALGPVAPVGPHPPALVVLPVWAADAPPEPDAEWLAAPEALVALAANAMDLDRDPETALVGIGTLARVPCVRLRYADAAVACAWIGAQAARPAPEVGPPTLVRPPAPGAVHPHRATPGVLLDERAVVWDPAGSRLVILNPEGTELWRGLDGAAPRHLEAADHGFLRLLAREGLLAGELA